MAPSVCLRVCAYLFKNQNHYSIDLRVRSRQITRHAPIFVRCREYFECGNERSQGVRETEKDNFNHFKLSSIRMGSSFDWSLSSEIEKVHAIL